MAALALPVVAPYHPRTCSRVIDDAYTELSDVAEQDFDWCTFEESVERGAARMRPLGGIGFIYCSVWEITGGLGLDKYHDFHTRMTAMQKGSRIIIALRTYKENNGRWPDSLQQIHTLVPQQALVDPFNGGQFIYRLDDDSFELYSAGKNAVDELGKHDSSWRSVNGADDHPIWPSQPQ